MSDFIDFIVRFKEQGLASVASNSNTLLGNVNKTLATTQQKSKFATQSIAEMNRQLDALKKRRDISVDTRQISAANRDIQALEQRISRLSNGSAGGSSSGGGIMGFVKGGLVAGGVFAMLSAAKSIATEGIQAAMDYGTKLKSFEVLTGNAGTGRQLANDLRSMKMNSLVGGGVYQNAQTMLGFGVSQGSVLRKIHEVGDVGMGDNEKMSALTLARSQTTAAGKLMGQDLLQYINAGFNPLSVMSEKWEQFGFKTKKTIGELKDLMEQGSISSEMVDKAFTVATSKGGRFYNMMGQIGETAGGKFLKLKGAWAATQIDIGNSLMPLASMAMEASNSLLHFIHIGQTVPESLRTEKLEVNTLVDSITRLNAGSSLRTKMIDTLKAKYPEFFSDIDKEKVKNEDLLGILNKVNKAYDKRINVSDHSFAGNVAKDERDELMGLAERASMQAQYNKSHSGFLDQTKYLSTYDRMWLLPRSGVYYNSDMTTAGLQEFARNAQIKAATLNDKVNREEGYVKNESNKDLLGEAQKLINNPDYQKKLWGKSFKKNSASFANEVSNWQKMYKENNGMFAGSFLNYDYSTIRSLLHPDTAGENPLVKAVDESGKRITGGGNRQVVINLNAPMIKDQTFNVGTMREAKEYSFKEQEDILLRIVQSINKGL